MFRKHFEWKQSIKRNTHFLSSEFLVALTNRIIIGKIFVFNYKCNPNVEMYFMSYLGRVAIGVGLSASLKLILREQKNTKNIILSLIFSFKTISNKYSGTFVADVGHAHGNVLLQYLKIMERKLPSDVVFQWRVLKPHSVKISLVIIPWLHIRRLTFNAAFRVIFIVLVPFSK